MGEPRDHLGAATCGPCGRPSIAPGERTGLLSTRRKTNRNANLLEDLATIWGQPPTTPCGHPAIALGRRTGLLQKGAKTTTNARLLAGPTTGWGQSPMALGCGAGQARVPRLRPAPSQRKRAEQQKQKPIIIYIKKRGLGVFLSRDLEGCPFQLHLCVGAPLGRQCDEAPFRRPRGGRLGATHAPGCVRRKGTSGLRSRTVAPSPDIVWRNHSILCLQKQRSSSPATDSPASVSMLSARWLRGSETDA